MLMEVGSCKKSMYLMFRIIIQDYIKLLSLLKQCMLRAHEILGV